MSNWIYEHLATCFFSLIFFVIILTFIFTYKYNQLDKQQEFLNDTLITLELKGHEYLKQIIEQKTDTINNGR
jgi:hypothetical protein